MKVLFSTVAATVAVFATVSYVLPVQAQQQTRITVDSKDYTVTEFTSPRGPQAMHLVQFADVQTGLSAMVSVQNGKITAYISPPGGGGQQDLINKVWKTYQDQKAGNAASAPSGSAPAQQQSGPNANDPSAALQAQTAAIQAHAQARVNGAPASNQQAGPVTFEFPASGGAIAHGTAYGDIIFNADATEAYFTRSSSNALAGNTSQTWSYEFVGQKNKAGATAKGLGGALAGAMNVRHAGRVDKGGIEVYLQTNGGKKEQEYGTEQQTFAVNPNVRAPLDNGVRQLAIDFLDAAKDALKGQRKQPQNKISKASIPTTLS